MARDVSREPAADSDGAVEAAVASRRQKESAMSRGQLPPAGRRVRRSSRRSLLQAAGRILIAGESTRRIAGAVPLVALSMAFGPRWVAAGNRGVVIRPGAGSFTFVDAQGDPSRAITVYTYLPPRLKAREAPIVFVLHGHGKNAPGYRDRWGRQAERHGFMVIAPLFDRDRWGGGDYSYASILDHQGRIVDPSKWSFSVVEHLFDAIREATGNRSTRYLIYGHSEGGQFVHRLILLLPEARYSRAVVANPGWYTMPRFDVRYPYGLAGSPVTEASLRTILGRDVVLMLGDEDRDPNDPDLRKSSQAMAQGTNRQERGHNFFREAERRAAELNCAFAWRRQQVRGGRHSDATMATAAAAALMGR